MFKPRTVHRLLHGDVSGLLSELLHTVSEVEFHMIGMQLYISNQVSSFYIPPLKICPLGLKCHV